MEKLDFTKRQNKIKDIPVEGDKSKHMQKVGRNRPGKEIYRNLLYL